MNKLMQAVLVISAIDKASRVIGEAVSKSEQHLNKLKQSSQRNFAEGFALAGTGVAIAASMAPAVKAFADLEDSSLRLKSVMMGSDFSPAMFKKVNDEAIRLGNLLPGTTADFQNLFAAMLEGGVPAKDIVEGVGQSAAYLAVQLKLPYEEAGRLAARIKESTGTAQKDMMALMDTIARTKNVGVQVDEMEYAFKRGAGGMKLLNIQGLEASKTMANLFAQMIKGGMGSGETIGTGFSTIFSSLANGDKLKKLNAEAAKFGVTMQFFDKNNNFLGIENFVAQLDKLKNLDPVRLQQVLSPLTGGSGQDLNMLVALAKSGVDGFNKMNQSLFRQASLNDKVGMQLGGLRNLWESLTGTFENTLATFGGAIQNELKMITTFLSNVTVKVQAFAEQNPRLFKAIGIFMGLASAILLVAGAVKIVIAAFSALKLFALLNPVVLAITAVAAVAALIYAYWEPISGFFIGLWNGIASFFTGIWDRIKGIILRAWEIIKAIFFNYTPHGLIYTHWGEISAWFASLWARVSGVFSRVWEGIKQLFLKYTPHGLIFTHWDEIVGYFGNLFTQAWAKFQLFIDKVRSIHVIFYEAGKNIVNSLWEGIKEMANKPVEAIADITKKMRDYLPFSPAKQGAFRDINRVKIVETIAGAIKPAPMVKAMRLATMATMAAAMPAAGATAPIAPNKGGGAPVSVVYSPKITIGSGSTEDKTAFSKLLKDHERDIVRLIEDAVARKQRKTF